MTTKLFHTGIEQKIISNLSKTKKEVEIAVAWFTNPTLFDVILELADKEIAIELILCDDIMNFTNTKLNFQRLIDLGVSIRVSKFPYLMHNKFCLIDSRVLINGSYNWTLRAEQFNFENIIISTDKELINDFSDYFEQIKDKTTRIINIPKATFQNYYSQKEIDLELELEKRDKDSLKDIEQKGNIVYTDKINQSIDKAELLYRNAEHLKCIEFCTKEIQENPKIPEFYLILASSYWRTDKKINL